MHTMLEKIFGSRTRVKLLRLFLTHPDEQYFVREIARRIGEQINSVRRELLNMEQMGFVQSQERDLKKYYIVSKEFFLYEELRALVIKSRLTLEKEFIESIRTAGNIVYLTLTGYFVNDATTQVDLLIVGDVNRKKLDVLLEKFKEQFNRQLRFTILSPEEFHYRKDVTDKFLYEILNGKNIIVINKL